MVLVIMSLMASWAGALYMARNGLRLGFVDTPDHRTAHNAPTPRGGGVGIPIVMVGSGLALGLQLVLLSAIVMVGLVSFADDRFCLSARVRLVIHLLAAALLVGSMGTFTGIHDLFPYILWILFIAGTGNAFNFMDGIDGMAGVSGTFAYALLGLYALSYQGNSSSIALLCFATAAACLGFLPLNYPRARVFMGDVGSIPLGFLFGALIFLLGEDISGILVMISFLLPFYIDTAITLFSRLVKGANITKPHKDHLYQNLVNNFGLSHRLVTAIYGISQLAVGLSMIYLSHSTISFITAISVGFCIYFGFNRRIWQT